MHPLRNDRTVEIAPADLTKFVKEWKHEPKVVDFGEDAPAAGGAAAAAAGGGKPTAAAGGPTAAMEKAAKPAKPAKEAKGPPPQDAGRKSGADAKGLEFTKAGNFPRWYEQVRCSASRSASRRASACYSMRERP